MGVGERAPEPEEAHRAENSRGDRAHELEVDTSLGQRRGFGALGGGRGVRFGSQDMLVIRGLVVCEEGREAAVPRLQRGVRLGFLSRATEFVVLRGTR